MKTIQGNRCQETAIEDFATGQMDAINSLPPRSKNYYYRMGWEDATYEMSLGRIHWQTDKNMGILEPIEV
ncbi:hypothetical protein V0288_12060 [Pannus brasiliensis CCIBt3594]|uniref:Uncharacterized protein n=1 Tax=Pannus brasiliensis CCIBt3594 TaxID=1427578 RepID=A0AAW9QJ68_9CHRO